MAWVTYAAVVIAIHVATVHAFEKNDLYGISHLTFVVENLQVSRKFYTDVLGGMLVEDLSTGPDGIYGDSHFYRIFQKEILDAEKTGQSLADVGVPDIRETGDHKVVWDFILMSNTLIQLMTFVNRYTGAVFIRKDPRIGNAFVTSTHSAVMADNALVPLQQMQDIINRQNDIPGYPENKKGFISSNPSETFEERKNQPLESFLLRYGNAFALAILRGPGGEMWEIAYRRGEGLKSDLGLFCKNKAVFSLMLDTKIENAYQNTLSRRIAGLSHTNAVVDDIRAAEKFYINVLGGIKNDAKSIYDLPVDESVQIDIFQNEILEAKSLGMKPDESFGILPAREGKSKSLYSFSFILFDNFYMEPYAYYPNVTHRAVPESLYRKWSSPAYINNLHTGFWVKNTVNMSRYIQNMESKCQRMSLHKVKVNRAVPVTNLGDKVGDTQYSDPFPAGHKLEGYDYVYFKGPSGEQLVLTQFLGKARDTLKAAMEKYGSLSTAFDSTNPWNWNGFQKMCKWLTS